MTKKLYLLDQYQQSFSAKVLEQKQNGEISEVVLEQTCFYPEGGGQGCDFGTINNLEVVDVQKQEGKIVHKVKSTTPLPDEVTGEINWERRFAFMQVHTCQHMLSQSLKQLFDLDTISVDLNIETPAAITVSGSLISTEKITKIENFINQVITQNKSINAKEVNKSDLPNYKLRRPVKEKILQMVESIRLVEVDDFDLVPCGGTHLKKSGEIGLVKIINTVKKNNTTTIEFVCGSNALRYFQIAHQITKSFAVFQHVKYEETVPRLEKHIEECEKNWKEVIHSKKEIQSLIANDLQKSALQKDKAYIVSKYFVNNSNVDIKIIAEEIQKNNPSSIIFLASKNDDKALILFACGSDIDIDMNEIFQKHKETLNAKGGGKSKFVQGMVLNTEKIEATLKTIIDSL